MATSSGNKSDEKKFFNHDWCQTDASVTVTLFPCGPTKSKGFKVDDVQADSKDSSITVRLPDNRVWHCDLNQDILPDYTEVRQKANKIIIEMMKKASGPWDTLEPQKGNDSNEDAVHIEKPSLELPTLKHDFYEKSADCLTLSIYVKAIGKDSLNVSFQPESFTIKFQTGDKSFLTVNNGTVDTLFMWTVALKAGIKPQSCRFKLSDTKLELFFIKRVPQRWNSLEEVPQKIRVVEVPTSTWISAVEPEPQNDSETITNDSEPLANDSKPVIVGFVDKTGKSSLNEERKDLVKPTCMVSPLNPKESPNFVRPGFTGLENLGNTCFMNSVLQCLANTRELRDYFYESDFKDDINVQNPLGMEGQLALAFAVLMRKLWMGNQSSFAPSKLKMLISRKATQFSGFAQHDAQEFMAFFLDILHEDLNRVKNKQYIENVNTDDKPDEVAGEESWKNYRKRNDSVIVDLFQGQYRSKLVCPICKKVSIVFDPFLYLPLPLPKEIITLSVFFFYKDPRPKPIKYKIRLSSGSTVHELLKKVSFKSNVSPVNLRLLVVRQDRIQSIIPSTPLSNVCGISEIFVFEVYDEKLVGEPVVEIMVQQRLLMPPTSDICAGCSTKDPSKASKLKRCTKCYRVAYCNADCQRAHWASHKNECRTSHPSVGLPFLFSLPESQATYSVVYRVLEGFSRHSVDVFQPPIQPSQVCQPSRAQASTSSPTPSKNTSRSGESPKPGPGGEGNEKAMSELSLADMKPDLPVEGSGQQTVRIVIGQPAEEYPIKPQFIIKHLERSGKDEGRVIDDDGNEPVVGLDCSRIAMDWKNDTRTLNYFLVQSKDLDYEDKTNGSSGKELDGLDECLKLFTEPEVLTSKDSWYCPSCKEHREATKQLSLWRLPPLLIIQLKRFSYGSMLHFREKLDKLIHFPIRGLDVSPYTCSSTNSNESMPLYDLYGVVNHMGGLLGGHYTSYVRTVDLKDSRRSEVDWRLCDDSHVMSVEESRVVSDSAYVLFYRRRGFQFNHHQNVPRPLRIENKNKAQKQLENELDSREEVTHRDSNIVNYGDNSVEPCVIPSDVVN